MNALTIARKEFHGYFNSVIAYVFITIFLALTSALFFSWFFVHKEAEMRGFFFWIRWVFLLFVPAVTMRLWAEERKLGTFEWLMTLPVEAHQVVIGKFLAAFAFLAVTVALSFPIAVVVYKLGEVPPDPGPIFCGYLGTLLMGGAYLALGLFISSLTENQIVAFILSAAAMFALLIVGHDFIVMVLPAWLAPVARSVGLWGHVDSIERGVIDSRDLLYYGSVTVFFLFLNHLSIESRKWR
jgi:ABC-2 type transport system permease protein